MAYVTMRLEGFDYDNLVEKSTRADRAKLAAMVAGARLAGGVAD
jgi:hypothetical protein